MSDQSTTVSAEVEWREVPGYPGYRASSTGQIQTRWIAGKLNPGYGNGSCKPKLSELWHDITTKIDHYGYCRFSVPAIASPTGLPIKGFAHRLVCLAFHGHPPSPKHEVAHFPNQDKTDNRPSNLSWKTRKENMAHKIFHGTHNLGQNHPCAKLTDEMVVKIRELVSSGVRQAEIARMLQVSAGTICGVIKRRHWGHVA